MALLANITNDPVARCILLIGAWLLSAVSCLLTFFFFFLRKVSLIFIPVCSSVSRGVCSETWNVNYENVRQGNERRVSVIWGKEGLEDILINDTYRMLCILGFSINYFLPKTNSIFFPTNKTLC